MAIYRMLRELTFGSRETARMTKAYETTLVELGFSRSDPRAETIAAAIIHRAASGETNIRRLIDFAKLRLNAEPLMPELVLQQKSGVDISS